MWVSCSFLHSKYSKLYIPTIYKNSLESSLPLLVGRFDSFNLRLKKWKLSVIIYPFFIHTTVLMNTAPKNCTFLIFLAYYDYTKSIVAQKKSFPWWWWWCFLVLLTPRFVILTLMNNLSIFLPFQRKSSGYKRSYSGSRVSGKIPTPKKIICSIEQKFFRLGLWHTKQR